MTVQNGIPLTQNFSFCGENTLTELSLSGKVDEVPRYRADTEMFIHVLALQNQPSFLS
jgi:hypothetical protein